MKNIHPIIFHTKPLSSLFSHMCHTQHQGSLDYAYAYAAPSSYVCLCVCSSVSAGCRLRALSRQIPRIPPGMTILQLAAGPAYALVHERNQALVLRNFYLQDLRVRSLSATSLNQLMLKYFPMISSSGSIILLIIALKMGMVLLNI